MSDLEKNLYEKYGSNKIPIEDIDEILKEISQKEPLVLPNTSKPHPMTVSDLMDYVADHRRNFLLNGELDLDFSPKEAYKTKIRENNSNESLENGLFKNNYSLYQNRETQDNQKTKIRANNSNESLEDGFLKNNSSLYQSREIQDNPDCNISDDEIMDKVLDAYFKYKKLHITHNIKKKTHYIYHKIMVLILILFCCIGYMLYIPAPY